MARTDTRYRAAYNCLLDHCATLSPGADLPAESALCEIAEVSRTVVRRCLGRLDEHGVISWDGRAKHVLRAPTEADRLEATATEGQSEDLEQRFLEWVLRFDVPAETNLSVAELSRTFGVSQHEFKEFLASLSRFGLVARRPRGGWKLLGFTRNYAIELSEFRAVLEVNAVSQVARLPDDHPIWPRLSELRAAHLSLRDRIETDYHDFSQLDGAFHGAINSIVRNRFISEFQKVISLIFYYHYLWDKTEEKTRNAAAIEEHLAIIDALEARDEEAAVEAAKAHLATSRTTLLSSLRHHDLG
ncbi:GntR family transcriptional regulator [Pelagovum pacificum]|uniref:GntR family transcriptional regulator n=1 Tax=Pelagovum pacificum TaxID=2588711 RepID=A0A5C5GF17_9RHOB|nr:GntR family transcriptional regulator [Pelagovum pacificum]QQA44332.1 GntR family transcriptional regulator [Pelagovum pacificum]TNY32549.1 GntR family transcriptional regulator [Pelagovum pacificum]